MKNKRQEKILSIIKEQIIVTQDDLQNALLSFGFNVTQSTVSRDIRELKLVKDHDENGYYRYVCAERQGNTDQPLANYRSLISSSVKSVNFAMNDVVIKCYTGMASSVCVAVDSIFSSSMLGSIAGDDTIFIVTHSTQEAVALTNEIKKLI